MAPRVTGTPSPLTPTMALFHADDPLEPQLGRGQANTSSMAADISFSTQS